MEVPLEPSGPRQVDAGRAWVEQEDWSCLVVWHRREAVLQAALHHAGLVSQAQEEVGSP